MAVKSNMTSSEFFLFFCKLPYSFLLFISVSELLMQDKMYFHKRQSLCAYGGPYVTIYPLHLMRTYFFLLLSFKCSCNSTSNVGFCGGALSSIYIFSLNFSPILPTYRKAELRMQVFHRQQIIITYMLKMLCF